jgi:hypothetical protein
MIERVRRLAALVLLATPALAGDPRPPQLVVSFLAEPAPIVQDGSTRLYYEMVVANYSNNPYVLDTVEARAGATDSSFEPPALEAMTVQLGARGQKPNPAVLTLDGGRSVIVFLKLDLGAAKAPKEIGHALRVRDDKGETHVMTIAPVAVSDEAPTVIGAPLRGDWIAGDSASNQPDAAHRRAVLVADGRAWIAQRYAIDWVQVENVNGALSTWRGPEDKNQSYFCYDQPIYSVAEGTVVDASDGMAENVPHSQKHVVAIDFVTAPGNHAVVEIAPHRYVLYAHMKPGTVAVKVGEKVHAGDLIGHVGNTGSSEEPHLHLHIDDRPSFLGGNGLPYEFAKGRESGPVEADVSAPTAITFGAIGPQHPFTDDYPAENALVTFGPD